MTSRIPLIASVAVLAAGLVFAAPTTRPATATATAPATQQALKPYPLKTCLVSGEDLGDMGDPVVLVYKGREIKFCCGGCVAKFKKDPEKYLKPLVDAEKKMPTTKPA